MDPKSVRNQLRKSNQGGREAKEEAVYATLLDRYVNARDDAERSQNIDMFIRSRNANRVAFAKLLSSTPIDVVTSMHSDFKKYLVASSTLKKTTMDIQSFISNYSRMKHIVPGMTEDAMRIYMAAKRRERDKALAKKAKVAEAAKRRERERLRMERDALSKQVKTPRTAHERLRSKMIIEEEEKFDDIELDDDGEFDDIELDDNEDEELEGDDYMEIEEYDDIKVKPLIYDEEEFLGDESLTDLTMRANVRFHQKGLFSLLYADPKELYKIYKNLGSMSLEDAQNAAIGLGYNSKKGKLKLPAILAMIANHPKVQQAKELYEPTPRIRSPIRELPTLPSAPIGLRRKRESRSPRSPSHRVHPKVDPRCINSARYRPYMNNLNFIAIQPIKGESNRLLGEKVRDHLLPPGDWFNPTARFHELSCTNSRQVGEDFIITSSTGEESIFRVAIVLRSGLVYIQTEQLYNEFIEWVRYASTSYGNTVKFFEVRSPKDVPGDWWKSVSNAIRRLYIMAGFDKDFTNTLVDYLYTQMPTVSAAVYEAMSRVLLLSDPISELTNSLQYRVKQFLYTPTGWMLSTLDDLCPEVDPTRDEWKEFLDDWDRYVVHFSHTVLMGIKDPTSKHSKPVELPIFKMSGSLRSAWYPKVLDRCSNFEDVRDNNPYLTILYSHPHESTVWCFDAYQLSDRFRSGNITNPYTQKEFDRTFVARMIAIYRSDQAIEDDTRKEKIQRREEEEKRRQYEQEKEAERIAKLGQRGNAKMDHDTAEYEKRRRMEAREQMEFKQRTEHVVREKPTSKEVFDLISSLGDVTISNSPKKRDLLIKSKRKRLDRNTLDECKEKSPRRSPSKDQIAFNIGDTCANCYEPLGDNPYTKMIMNNGQRQTLAYCDEGCAASGFCGDA